MLIAALQAASETVLAPAASSLADQFWNTAISAIISSGVVATVLGLLFHRWSKSVEGKVRLETEKALNVATSTREWNAACLGQVLGPMKMHLGRTEQAFKRWRGNNEFIEAKVIRRSNETMRDLLLGNGHLIPGDLTVHAFKLIEHFDAWLEEFDHQRSIDDPNLRSPFIFVGPKGFPFPVVAERAFKAKFDEISQELYGPFDPK